MKLSKKQYKQLASGQIVRRGPKARALRARKDKLFARSYHPCQLIETGAPGRRKGRTVWASRPEEERQWLTESRRESSVS